MVGGGFCGGFCGGETLLLESCGQLFESRDGGIGAGSSEAEEGRSGGLCGEEI